MHRRVLRIGWLILIRLPLSLFRTIQFNASVWLEVAMLALFWLVPSTAYSFKAR
jgi:hypothetical protein